MFIARGNKETWRSVGAQCWWCVEAINMLLLRSKTKNHETHGIDLHRLIRLRLLCGFFSFQLGELLFGLHVAGLISERSQP